MKLLEVNLVVMRSETMPVKTQKKHESEYEKVTTPCYNLRPRKSISYSHLNNHINTIINHGYKDFILRQYIWLHVVLNKYNRLISDVMYFPLVNM